MKEIKFRGRMKRTKQWVYGDLAHVQGQPCIQVDVSTDERKTVGMNVEPDSVGQFTGLHDKNGKEIYEGDIVHVDAWYPNALQVLFLEGSFCLCNRQGYYVGDFHHVLYGGENNHSTILGNVIDNPELLN